MDATSTDELGCRLGTFSPTDAEWAAWTAQEPAQANWTFQSLRDRLLDPHESADQKDQWLRSFVRLAQRQDGSAPRLAVAALLLPGLNVIVRRYQGVLGRDETWAVVVLGLWAGIEDYDLAGRPQRVAANLLWACRRAVLEAVRRELAWREQLSLSDLVDGFGDEALPAPEDLVLAPAVDAGVLTDVDAALIAATRLGGVPLSDIATVLGISYEAAKKRRQRAEAEWVAWWRPDLRRAA